MRETLMENNILPGPQRKVGGEPPSTHAERLDRSTDRYNPAFDSSQTQHFMKLFTRFLESRSRPALDWKQVEPFDPAQVQDFDSIPPCPQDQVRGDWIDPIAAGTLI